MKKSHITKSHPTSLTLNFGYTKATDIVVLPDAPGAENKVKSLVVDYHDNTEALLDTAQNLLSFGRYDDAIAQIKENPVAIYEDEKACAMLIKLYLQNKSYVKAEAVASQGSTIFSSSMEIKKVMGTSKLCFTKL